MRTRSEPQLVYLDRKGGRGEHVGVLAQGEQGDRSGSTTQAQQPGEEKKRKILQGNRKVTGTRIPSQNVLQLS